MQEERNENLRPLANFHVRLVRDDVAALYETSAFAAQDLKEVPRLVRRAVALGRACADPLAVLAALLDKPHDELLSLQLHPLQVLAHAAAFSLACVAMCMCHSFDYTLVDCLLSEAKGASLHACI